MTRKTINLAEQLTALINDFGYAKVHRTLNVICSQNNDATDIASCENQKPARKNSTSRPVKPRPDAVAVVASLNIVDSEKRAYLMHIAKKYEDKRFMPNVNHVRAFLMYGTATPVPCDPSRIKSRQQVTSKVFKQLASLDIAELHKIENSGLYDPPKRLATYAEAIENFGNARRLQR